MWEQIEALLREPEVIFKELQQKETEAASREQQLAYWQADVKSLERRLVNVEKQKDRAWKAFELTGGEARFKGDIAKCDEDKTALLDRKAVLEQNMQAAEQSRVNVDNIKKACELVKRNLEQFTYEDKRLALEALQVRVLVDGDTLDLEGVIPLDPGPIVSAASRGGEAPS